jgi:hypothetical protein
LIISKEIQYGFVDNERERIFNKCEILMGTVTKFPASQLQLQINNNPIKFKDLSLHDLKQKDMGEPKLDKQKEPASRT